MLRNVTRSRRAHGGVGREQARSYCYEKGPKDLMGFISSIGNASLDQRRERVSPKQSLLRGKAEERQQTRLWLNK